MDNDDLLDLLGESAGNILHKLKTGKTRLSRPYLKPNGEIEIRSLEVCECGNKKRGPNGGVCGRCGGAIK